MAAHFMEGTSGPENHSGWRGRVGRLRSLGGGDLAQGSVVVRAQPLSPHSCWGSNYLELFTPAIQTLPGPAGENQLESLVRARETGAVWRSAGWLGGGGAKAPTWEPYVDKKLLAGWLVPLHKPGECVAPVRERPSWMLSALSPSPPVTRTGGTLR